MSKKKSDAVCCKHLDEEYAELARDMTAVLARKRPSPLERGRKDVWAAAIVYSLANVNFLFDKTQVPHMKADEMDPMWWRPSKMESNLLAWMVMINGLAVDARALPVEIQEELVKRKLIPFVPGNAQKS